MPLPAQPFPLPSKGQKRPSADLITLNSASQTFVNSQPLYRGRAGCQRLLFFLCRCCALATLINLPISTRLSKTFLTYFPPPKPRIHKERGGENILSQNLRKSFFNFFSLVFRASNHEGFLSRNGISQTGAGASSSDSIRLFDAPEESALGDDISIILSRSIPPACKAPIVSMA